ncbi:acyl-CoA dehydrogenase family protein [Anaerococcus degeneri]|uniref:Acyl-CoA dehydrogenase family protein n=1 Tax=Anaerococcus degeneri TaxID=361500 RepID=A0ABS7YYV9_9FIRM|nr:acyl-CoA dehydrogenase family protein [Anaerococcus degeneri]MBP2014712.1 alkylation response protein AidB-like acyl-CoA dehydrogenase [Anaerococcus degeneri]MCA2096923.1 acyl-CoA dehydrogenase family protein [Anaerococcus degeneri]
MTYKMPKDIKEFRKFVRDFAEEKIRPLAAYMEEDFPVEILSEIGEAGLLSLPFEEKFGGCGLSYDHYATVVEETARVNSGLASLIIAHTSLATWPINKFANEKQKEKYLNLLLDGKNLGGLGHFEEDEEIQTTAIDEGDYFLLNGKKILVTNARLANYYLVTALTNPRDKENGLSIFILDKDCQGLSFSKTYDNLGSRSVITGDLILKDAKVPKENLIGDLNKANEYIDEIFEASNLATAALALGLGDAAYEASQTYLQSGLKTFKARKAAKVNRPILASMATDLKAAKMMVRDAALKMDAKADFYGKDTSMAKLFVSKLAEDLTSKALDMCGGTSSSATDLDKLYRDAKISQIYDGPSDQMKETIAAYILDKKGAKKATKAEENGKKAPAKVEDRKKEVFVGDIREAVKKVVAALLADGLKLKKDPVDLEGPIEGAERVVAVGMGLGEKQNLDLAKELANITGSVLGASRPAAQVRHYVSDDHYIGVSGKKFTGELYFGIGISGTLQHLKGIDSARKVVVINNDEGAQFFKNCDYGIVGDFTEVLPILIEEIKNL